MRTASYYFFYEPPPDPIEYFVVSQEEQIKAVSGLKLLIQNTERQYFPQEKGEPATKIKVLVGIKNVSSHPILIENRAQQGFRGHGHIGTDILTPPQKCEHNGFTVFITKHRVPSINKKWSNTYLICKGDRPSFRWLYPNKMLVQSISFSHDFFDYDPKNKKLLRHNKKILFKLQLAYQANSETVNKTTKSWQGILYSNVAYFQVVPNE